MNWRGCFRWCGPLNCKRRELDDANEEKQEAMSLKRWELMDGQLLEPALAANSDGIAPIALVSSQWLVEFAKRENARLVSRGLFAPRGTADEYPFHSTTLTHYLPQLHVAEPGSSRPKG